METIDIYNCENSNDIYNPITFKLLCKKSFGDKKDQYGRFYEAGEWYEAKLEIYPPKEDTKWQEFRSCWVSHKPMEGSDRFGSRFAVKGNVYTDPEKIGYWRHFTEHFHCPIQIMREQKIEKILDDNRTATETLT